MPRSDPPLSTAMLDAAVDLIGRPGVVASVAVTGVSMHPTFAGVEQLAVEFAQAKLHFGDVLVFRQRGNLVVHRLVQPGRKRLRTRGDGTISFDPWLDRTAVIGRVIALGYPGNVWRRARGVRPGLYGGMLAAHDLCWGGLGAAALKFMGKNGADWHWRLGGLDLFKLGVVHAVLFGLMHPRTSPPVVDVPGSARSEARCYTSTFDRSKPRKKPDQQ